MPLAIRYAIPLVIRYAIPLVSRHTRTLVNKIGIIPLVIVNYQLSIVN